jgi:hypothetical protein
MALSDQVQELITRVGIVEKDVSDLKTQTKIEREIKQVVFEKEGDITKVRRLVVIKKPTGIEEVWEDATAIFTKETAEEVLKNGA